RGEPAGRHRGRLRAQRGRRRELGRLGAGRGVLMNRTWPGHLTLTLRSGEAPSTVPCHVDRLAGAVRPANRLDGGALDRALRHWGGGARITAVYHARRSLGRLGEQHAGYDDLEEGLGMSRT